MTRFISQYPEYSVQIRKQIMRPLGDGQAEIVQAGLYAKFTSADKGGMIYDKERREAEDRFQVHGRQQEQDQATPIDIIHRLSVFDTDDVPESWTDEDVELAERTLRDLALINPNAFIVMQGTPIPPPFPAYDVWEGTPQELVLKLTGDGFDLNEVILYERQFGQDRPEVIEALKIGAEALEELTVSG